MENVENLIIEHLKSLRSEVARLRFDMQDEFRCCCEPGQRAGGVGLDK